MKLGKVKSVGSRKEACPLAAPPEPPHPSPWQSTVSGFCQIQPDTIQSWAGGQAHVCAHIHTQTHCAGRQSGLWACTVEAAGLCHWTTRASEPWLPCSEPLGRVMGKRVRPPSVQSLPWTPRIPTEHPLGMLSPCFPALQRGWPPPLPSSPASFPAQSYRAGADPACCWPVWGAHTSQRYGGPWPCAPGTLGHAPRPQPPPWT